MLLTLVSVILWLPWCHSAVADEFPVVGEWPCFQGNATLNGRAAGTGRIGHPRVAWRDRFEATVTQLAISPAGESRRQALTDVEHALVGPVNSARWFQVPMGTIAGDEQAIVPSDTTTYADVLPEVPGLEKIEFESGFDLPTKDGQWQYGPGRLLAWRNNRWDPVWEGSDMAWECQETPVVLHQQNGAEAGRIAALTRRVRGQDVMVTRSRWAGDPGSIELSVQRWDGSQLRPEPTLVARHAEVLALDSTGSMLTAVQSVTPSDAQVYVRNGKLEILTSAPGAMQSVTPPAVAYVAGQDSPLIVAQDTSL